MTGLVTAACLAFAVLGGTLFVLPRRWITAVPILEKSLKNRVIVRLFGLWLFTEPVADIIAANPEGFSDAVVSRVQPAADLALSTALVALLGNLLFGGLRLLATGVFRLEGLLWRPLPFMSWRPARMDQHPEGYRIKERLFGLAAMLITIPPTVVSARWAIDATVRLWSGS